MDHAVPVRALGDMTMITIAYLVNQYPKLSHSFIRREIAAVEAQGVRVERFTVRSSGESLCEPLDRAEAAKTTILLDGGVAGLLLSTLLVLASRPVAFMSALALACRIGWRSERGLLCHMVYLMEACTLLRHLRARAIRHVHAHFGTNAATVAMLCRSLGGPTFSMTVHGCEEFDKPQFIALAQKVERAAFVAAVSQFGRSQLCRWTHPCYWDHIHVVHCGVDPSFLRQQPTSTPETPRLVSVGRLCREKGQMCMIEAARRLRDWGVAFTLDLIGEGELRGDLEAAIARDGLNDCVRLLGAQDGEQVRRHIVASRALVLSSFAENLPVTLMESLALHRPVIATRIAGIPELVEHDVTGYLVTPGCADELADAMARVLAAPTAELDRMGREGARRVALRHDVTREAATLVRLFRAQVEAAAPAGVIAQTPAEDAMLERRIA